MHRKNKNYYDILNVRPDCTSQEIRDSFVKLSKEVRMCLTLSYANDKIYPIFMPLQYHPDTSKSGNAKMDNAKFQNIMEAYKILGKTDLRANYDSKLRGPRNYGYDPGQDYTYSYNYAYETMRAREREKYYEE